MSRSGFWRGPPLFYFDFLVFPVLAIGLLVMFCRSWSFVGLMACGVVLFSFAEYWVHRIALHRFFYHGVHERHHDHPAEYVVFPIWYTPLIFSGLFFVMPLAMFTGVVFGFCWFLYWHHVLHHFDLTKWPRSIQRYAIWHLGHHRDPTRNFGITVSAWDWLFGTYR